MEYGMRLPKSEEMVKAFIVLILILLEYGMRPIQRQDEGLTSRRLNPYSIGIWYATVTIEKDSDGTFIVLILILLEYGMRLIKS